MRPYNLHSELILSFQSTREYFGRIFSSYQNIDLMATSPSLDSSDISEIEVNRLTSCRIPICISKSSASQIIGLASFRVTKPGKAITGGKTALLETLKIDFEQLHIADKLPVYCRYIADNLYARFRRESSATNNQPCATHSCIRLRTMRSDNPSSSAT